MKLKALLYLDDVYIDEIKPLLMEEDVEVYDLFEKKNILEEISKGYLDILFFSCACNYCTDDFTPTIKKIKKLDPRLEIICVGTREDEAMAVEAIKCGASACIGTPINMEQLRETIITIRDHALYRNAIYQIESVLHEKYTFSDMVSKNPAMLDIFTLIKRVSPYFRTMLITGDTGTGKEVLAKAVHHLSPAAEEPFMVCNCSGMVENLIESELFGHEKGAFTGAVSNKQGLFEAAGNGTIFLDEIGDMPLSFQPHLLRVLQDGEFRRVGSTRTMKAGCRVIAATHVDLAEKVRKGGFREDLFFRLSVITIELPPLKERKEDIPLLSRFFLNKLNGQTGKNIRGISMDAKNIIMSYDWPGNVRELENAIERAMLVTPLQYIRSEDLPSSIKVGRETGDNTKITLEAIEKNHITKILLSTGGNKTKAADVLGISRRALSRKIEKHEIEH